MSEKKSTLTIKVGDVFECEISEIKEDVYYPALKMIQSGKSIDAAFFIIRNQYVSGDKIDEVNLSLNDKLGIENALADVLKPTDYEVKKNT